MVRKKILFIEDEEDLIQAYKSKFSKIYDAEFATDAEAGLKKAGEWKPDLIVLDIIIPGEKNGLAVLEELKNNPATSEIPVIVLTNLENEEKTVLRLGASACLVKAQTSFDKVTEVVESYL